MSSSLARTRSLRKPAPVSASTSSTPSVDSQPGPDARHGSPSRLPVKPPSRSTTAAPSTTTTTSQSRLATATAISSTNGIPGASRTGGPALRQPRSVSGPRVRPTPGTQPTPEPSRRDATAPTTTTTSRYPPLASATRAATTTTTTTTGRSIGTARPTSSNGGQTATKRVLPTHKRAKSTVTTGNSNAAAGIQPRAPSHQAANGSLSRPPQLQRASPDKAPPAASVSTPVKQQQPPLPAAAAPRLRPTFSALQQHYSPAKSAAPKPLTSAILAPPSPSKLPANVAASAETSRLQTELLQLHLVHRDAAAVDAQWRDSAREKLGRRFEGLVEATRDVAERDRAAVEGDSVLVLRAWEAAGGLEERVQALDGVVNGLWTLTEAGGRYPRLVRRFERWIDEVSELEQARQTGQMAVQLQRSGGPALFVGELDSSWKDDVSSITRRLDGWSALLRDVCDVPEDSRGSNLARMLEGARALIDDTLAELGLMVDIEAQILAREDAWIERMNRDEDGDDTPVAGAVWRLV